KAKVYGSKTFGKGIVQTTHEFDDGSLLKFTNMKWLTPKSRYIHGKGINPDTKINEPEYQSLSVIPNTQTYQLGDEDKHVKTIKVGLSALNYQSNNKSKHFDTELEDTIKSLHKNKNVKTIKVDQSELNYKSNNKSKHYNKELEDTIKSFQKDNNLTVNGKFNKQTNDKFTQALVNKANKEDTVLQTLLNKLK